MLEEQNEKKRAERQKPDAPPDFWADTAIADAALSRALMCGEEADFEKVLQAAGIGYRRAFDNRSTSRERDSVLDHLDDLALLHPDPGRGKRIADLRKERSS